MFKYLKNLWQRWTIETPPKVLRVSPELVYDPILDQVAGFGKGWHKLVLQGYAACAKAEVPLLSVKEKYGTLRFNTVYLPTMLEQELTEIEWQSGRTCESCGAFGMQQERKGWVVTRCADCFEKETRS